MRPRAREHCVEVVIRIDGCRYLLVVANPLIKGDTAITVALRALEGVEELLERLLLGNLTRNHARVLAHAVDAADVVHSEVATLSSDLVKHIEDLLHHRLARRAQAAANGAQELLVAHRSVTVPIECLHQDRHILA